MNRLAESLIRIRNKPISLYDYQKKFMNDGWYFRIVNKSRQTGISLIISIEATLHCMFKNYEIIPIVSKDDRGSRLIIDYVQEITRSMERATPFVSMESESATELTFPSGSKIISIPNSPEAVRGYPATRIYLDEFAHYNKQEEGRDKEMLTAASPTISRGGFLTISSTPYGFYNEFAKIWHENYPIAKDFSCHRIHWTACPELVRTGYSKLMATLPEPKEINFQQEFCNRFLESVTGFIPVDWYDRNVDDKLERWA